MFLTVMTQNDDFDNIVTGDNIDSGDNIDTKWPKTTNIGEKR
jgi:hypothetical protein